jgi:hypothetical protein
MTYSYAKLPVTRATYDEIADKLRKAEYHHAFIDGVMTKDSNECIDMHGIALCCSGEERDFALNCYPDLDTMSADQLREALVKELQDVKMLADCSYVYDHVTNGKALKPNTVPSVIIALHDEHVTELVNNAVSEYIKDHSDEIAAAIESLVCASMTVREGKEPFGRLAEVENELWNLLRGDKSNGI